MTKSPGPRGPKPVIQWMLQIEGGRTLGPLKTEDVIFRISEGIVSGNEKIKRYPDGQWTTVSREPVFYDYLLEVLEKTVEENKIKKQRPPTPPPPQPSQPQQQQIVQMPRSIKNDEEVEKTQATDLSKKLPSVVSNVSKTSLTASLSQGSALPQVVSNSTKPPTQKNFFSLQSIKNKKPNSAILFFGAAVIFLFLAYYTKEVFFSDPDYIQLKYPKIKTKISLDEASQKKLLDLSYRHFFLDQVSSYLEAQDHLVELVEGNPQHAQARGLLCLVHKELWPFVKQDSKDIDIFQISRKGARLIDPVGENGVLCEITYLMALGKYQNAMGLADHFTNNPNNEVSPFLYLIKSELYAADRKYKDAIAYANDVVQKIPNWSKAMYMLSGFYDETNQFEQAFEKYGALFKINPQHRNGLIDYGAMMYSKGQETEEALKVLLAAENNENRIGKSSESKLHYFLSRIYSDKKKQSQSLDHAIMAYQLNPGDIKARDLLIRLGGSPNIKVKSDKNNELVFLGDQYYRAGDCLSASAEYRAAFEFDPQNSLAATKAARCLWQLSQIENAFLWLSKAIQADPKFSWPYYLMSDYYSQRYSFHEAMQVLGRASQKIANNAEILKGYGLVELRRNNFKDAIAYLERSRKVFENDPETLVLLSKAYAAKSPLTNYEKALQMAVKAIELEDTYSEAHVSYAQILVATKGVEAGALYMKDLMKKYSYNQEFRLCLAQIYKEAERYSDAKDLYEHAILNEEKNKPAMIGLGESYQGLGQFNSAINIFLKAAVIDPADPEPLVKAGLVFLEAGRTKEAMSQLERAKKLNPNYPRVNYLLGRAAFSVKDFTNALKYAANEKEYNPNLAEPYLLSGEIYFAVNDYIKCAKEYEMAVKLRPQGAENYVKLAVCHLNAGNTDIAESMLNIANYQESGFAEIYKIQGEIHEKRGERDAAVQAYTKYITLSPNAPDKKTYELRINKLGGEK